jgi:hypothetical protein
MCQHRRPAYRENTPARSDRQALAGLAPAFALNPVMPSHTSHRRLASRQLKCSEARHWQDGRARGLIKGGEYAVSCLRLAGGHAARSRGPGGDGEPGFALIKVDTKEKAIEWVTNLRRLCGDGESEIVQDQACRQGPPHPLSCGPLPTAIFPW